MKSLLAIESKIMKDPSATTWLKEQIERSKQRDILDAIADTEALLMVLQSRWDQMAASAPNKVTLR